MSSTIATATAVDQSPRRLVRLVPAGVRQERQELQDSPEPPEPAPAPTVGHDRGRPAHCRIAMQFED
ncbi:hypothetical protein [Kitasatospora sp. NBC_01300]|uniref:hypothetical protein n=1 Tax=Kitasatospora sp. NBC_01300 TaxID=2903574 RepID=UPI00352C04AA|nr:hypothetical protein OG556_05280 [Kitasatospora sp. NBC_01300]